MTSLNIWRMDIAKQEDDGRRPLLQRVEVRLERDAPVVLEFDLGGGHYDAIGLGVVEV